MNALQQEASGGHLLRADALYQWFKARAQGETLVLLDAAGAEVARFTFPRQTGGEGLCLTDWVRDDVDDYVALFVITCGAGVRERSTAWREQGDYLRSHALQALAIECAEALAELLHARLRDQWGFPDPPELTMEDSLKARYRGLRVSFGYPACPELADQVTLFRLLRPEDIGVHPHRGVHDGPRGLGLGARLPPSCGAILQGGVAPPGRAGRPRPGGGVPRGRPHESHRP